MKAVIKLADKQFTLINENGVTTNDDGKGQAQSAEDFIKFIDDLVEVAGAELVEKDY